MTERKRNAVRVEYDQLSIRALARAVELVGGQKAMAEAISTAPCYVGEPIKQQHVWKWLRDSPRVPAEYVLAIEHATGNKVKRHELRGDLYPVEET